MNIPEILASHAKWIAAGGRGPGRANLHRPDLSGADFTGADFTGADLTGAILTGANLSGADLSGADLTGADLTGAILTGANLTEADLTEADLSKADLSEADLRWANLSEADLTGANLGDLVIPVVPQIDAAILTAVEGGGRLNMNHWHICDTTHCRAGWTVKLAGKAGAALEDKIGTNAAAALIYTRSRPGQPVPDWYAHDEDALADIRVGAARDAGAQTERGNQP